MRKILFSTAILLCIGAASFAQKKSGTIYSEHEMIDKTRALWGAFAKGDLEAYKGFFADSVFVSSNGNEGRLIARSEAGRNVNWFKEEFVNVSVVDNKPAYPDALDYKDGIDWAQDWTLLTATHVKTGINVELPMHNLYGFNDKGKIVVMHSYFNNNIFEKIRENQTTSENGEVYKSHPYILEARKSVNAFAAADADAYASFFTPDAEFSYSWLEFGETRTLEDELKGVKNRASKGVNLKMVEVGYPDCVYYELGGGYVVYSWWKQVKMKDGKKYEFPIMLSHSFNDDGKIVRTVVYASNNHFKN